MMVSSSALRYTGASMDFIPAALRTNTVDSDTSMLSTPITPRSSSIDAGTSTIFTPATSRTGSPVLSEGLRRFEQDFGAAVKRFRGRYIIVRGEEFQFTVELAPIEIYDLKNATLEHTTLFQVNLRAHYDGSKDYKRDGFHACVVDYERDSFRPCVTQAIEALTLVFDKPSSPTNEDAWRLSARDWFAMAKYTGVVVTYQQNNVLANGFWPGREADLQRWNSPEAISARLAEILS